MKQCLACIAVLSLMSGCGDRRDAASPESKQSPIEIKYAEGFRVTDTGFGLLVEVTQPYQTSPKGHKYLLIGKDESVPDHDSETKVIRVPISTIVCTSTTHIPLLDYIGATEALVGFPTTDYISSEKMRKRIDAGNVAELGVDKGMDLERIAEISPDMVMGYTMSADYGQFRKLESLGVPVVINAEYLEKHPLGRAEWIKFMALFFKKEKVADSVFRAIESKYNETSQLVTSDTSKPAAMSGVVYGDTWFLPGGRNYAARLLQDAGYDYLWSADESNGFLELSFESVYERAHNAEYWIGVASFKSLKEIESADNRYALFKPFKEGKVYTYDARKGAKGGSEFLELGYLRPDIILMDLVKIGHPELLPGYEPYFHKRLK